jgi:hypothetical protein
MAFSVRNRAKSYNKLLLVKNRPKCRKLAQSGHPASQSPVCIAGLLTKVQMPKNVSLQTFGHIFGDFDQFSAKNWRFSLKLCYVKVCFWHEIAVF